MGIKEAIINALSTGWEPQIVHQTPGRLRVHLPLLKKVPGHYHRDTAGFIAMASLIPGIHETSASPVTGNVLIRFDHQRFTVGDIMNAFSVLNQLAIRNSPGKSASPAQRIGELRSKLPGILPGIDLKTLNVEELETHVL